jgi:hypothetical protein
MSVFVLVVQDHESYMPEAFGPFADASVAGDYQNYLEPRPPDENCQVMPVYGPDE